MTPPAQWGKEEGRGEEKRGRASGTWTASNDQWKDQHTIFLDNKILSAANCSQRAEISAEDKLISEQMGN